MSRNTFLRRPSSNQVISINSRPKKNNRKKNDWWIIDTVLNDVRVDRPSTSSRASGYPCRLRSTAGNLIMTTGGKIPYQKLLYQKQQTRAIITSCILFCFLSRERERQFDMRRNNKRVIFTSSSCFIAARCSDSIRDWNNNKKTEWNSILPKLLFFLPYISGCSSCFHYIPRWAPVRESEKKNKASQKDSKCNIGK